MEYEDDPDYDMLKNLFKNILIKENINKENFYIYDWDIENKYLNTITTNNTSHKAVFDKEEKEKNFYNKYKYNKYNIIDTKNNYTNKINETEGDKDKEKNFSIRAKNTKEDFYSSQILYYPNYKKIMNTEEKIIKHKYNKIKKDFEDDFDYQNIMEMTDEGKSNDIKKLPNVFGYIHSKGQLENKNQYNQNQNIIEIKKTQDENRCIIF